MSVLCAVKTGLHTYANWSVLHTLYLLTYVQDIRLVCILYSSICINQGLPFSLFNLNLGFGAFFTANKAKNQIDEVVFEVYTSRFT